MNKSPAFIARLSKVKQLNKYTILNTQCYCSKRLSTSETEEIVIPNRIHRGPTDVLRALESTISRDPTAAHFKYHDDPYLIPRSNLGKRSFALAQESGRKAAQWIRREHADLFQHKEMNPIINSFLPSVIYTEKSDVKQEDLKKCIETAQVSDAILVYKLMKEKSIEIPVELEQSLLELVCFYNSENKMDDEYIEERWFTQQPAGISDMQRAHNSWNDGAFAEELFISIDGPSAETYSAIIRGMAKHLQAIRAWQLYEEAEKKNLVLTCGAYNSMLTIVNYLKEDFVMRWTLIQHILSRMNELRIRPNLETLNAVLQSLSTIGNKNAKEIALEVLAEFKRLGVEPSLGSWHYVLKTFCKQRTGGISTVLHDIMREIENKSHEIRHISDVNFFVTAMDVCNSHLHDMDLAERVYRLLHHGDNYDLIGDSFRESLFYRNFFYLLCTNKPLDEFMRDWYFPLVPHIYIPEPSITNVILDQVEVSGEAKYVPKLWSDMVIFEQSKRENLIVKTLNVMVTSPATPTEELTAQFAGVASSVYNLINEELESKRLKFSVTGEILGNILILLSRAKEADKAWKVMAMLNKKQNVVSGIPPLNALAEFIDLCIEQKVPSQALVCLRYSNEVGYPETEELARKLQAKLTLDEKHLETLAQIVGSHVLEDK